MAFMFIPEFPEHHRANACISCQVQRRPEDRLIDLGFWTDVSIDEVGQPAFMEIPAVMCETCVRELASMIGFMEPADARR